MWPNLMGPGWQQQFLMAAGLLVATFAAFWMLASAAARLETDEPPDALLKLWHRYEEGDLTRWEFERVKRTLRERPSATEVDQRPRAEVSHASVSVGEGRI